MSPSFLPRVLSLLAALVTAASVVSARQSNDTPLTAGASAARTLTAGDTHVYRLALSAGQCLSATVSSPVTGTQVRLLTPGGDTAREMSLAVQGGGARPDAITFVAAATGEYRIEVRAATKDVRVAYTLAIQDVRAASEGDRLRAAAEQSYWDAEGVYAKRGAANFRRALDMFRESLPLWQKLGDPWFEGNVLTEIGGLHRLLAENEQALDYYRRALPILRASGNRRDEAGTLNNIAAVSYSRGEVKTAFDYFNQALEVVGASGDRQAQSILLNNMGTLYQAQGEHQTALDYLNRALVLRREVQDRAGEVRTLNNLSLMYRLLGDVDASKQTAEQALALADALQDRQLRAASVNTLGTIERVRGELPAAEGHLEQALTLFRELGEARLASATLNNLGELHQTQGRTERARTEFEQALAEARAAQERQREAYTLRNLGGLALDAGQAEQALVHFERAVDIDREIRDQEGEAESLREIGRALDRQGRIGEALARSQAALGLIESLRSKVGSPQLRTTYFSSKRPYYEQYVDLLMRTPPTDGAGAQASSPAVVAALEASERARARSLLDLLRESGIAIREGVGRDLVDREAALRQRINVVESSRVRALAGRPDPVQVATIEKELDGLFLEYQQAQAAIRAKSPHYAALSQADAVRVGEIQQALDSDTLLLEYMLADERSYVWAVTATSLVGHELPNRALLEALARDVYAHASRETTPIGTARAASGVAPAGANRGSVSPGERARAELSRVLLEPVASQLGTKRLVVVADGALLYVPFTLLDSPSSAAAASRPLILDHEIVHLPSVSSLLVMRRGSNSTRGAGDSVAIMADPVFAADDLRIRRPVAGAARQPELSANAAGPAHDLRRSASDRGIGRFPRLPGTRREAASIAALVTPNRRFEALDFAASRETALSDGFGRHRIIHFATHGLINSVHPELSGLVLSLVDSNGLPQDGFLRLHDIYNLKLDAELVVLSACQTALGRDTRGEGLIGLTRGFMYAGAPRVVASLWDVEDRATAELMTRFYEGMLVRHESPAAALRNAQLTLLRDRRWSDAYYWGAFVLQGEWR